MSEFGRVFQDYDPVDSDTEVEVYDVPPQRCSRPSHSEADYMNFKELEILPIPELPPKKRTSADLDAKLGMSSPSDRISAQCLPATALDRSSVGSVRKGPVAAPRVKAIESKQPVAAPRKGQTSFLARFLILPDATTGDSADGDFEDQSNNNLCNSHNQNMQITSGKDNPNCSTSSAIVNKKAEPNYCNLSNLISEEALQNNYINTSELLSGHTKVQPEDYEERRDNIKLSPVLPSISSSTESQGLDFAMQPTPFVPVSQLEVTNSYKMPSSVPADNALNSLDYFRPDIPLDARLGRTKPDYVNISKSTSKDVLNASQPIEADITGINLKEIMVQCLDSSTVPSQKMQAYPAVWNDSGMGESAKQKGSMLQLPDIFYDLVSSGDNIIPSSTFTNKTVSGSNNRSPSFYDQNLRGSEFFGSSPPKFTPPPLPSDLLIDLSEDNLYKTPSSSAPVIPCRAGFQEPCPPVPARKGCTETQTESKWIESSNIPASLSRDEPTFHMVQSSSNAVIAAGTALQKQTSGSQPSKPVDMGGRSVFYMESSANLYEMAPAAYEMECSAFYALSNSTSMTSDHNGLLEQAGNSFQNSNLRGFLYLTGSTSKTEKKWCKLDSGCLSIFSSNQNGIPQDVIERVAMVSIANVRDESRQNCFELSARPPSVVYQFSADSANEKTAWIKQIARNIVATVDINGVNQITDLERGGIAFVRFGAESEWIHTWLHLFHKTLCVLNQDDKFEDIDLRKSKGLRNLQLTDRCTKGFETCPPLAIDFPNGRVIYIQSDLKSDQDGWSSALLSSIMMVDNCLENQPLTADNVPVMVDKCINFVSAFGLEVEGIYRLNGQASKVTKLQEEFRSDIRGMIIRSPDYHIHDVATALKRFFRQLDDPLLTRVLYNGWIEASGIENRVSQLEAYKKFLDVLPRVNYCTLKRVVTHIAQVADKKAVNKMDSTNLASIFGPILFKVDTDSKQAVGYGSTNQEIKIVKDLVDNRQRLFDIKEEEIDHEKKIADAVKRIEKLNMAKSNQSPKTILEEGVLLGVYICDKKGDVVTLKIPKTMRAGELQIYVAEKAQVSATKDWNLFEVICNGELERPIHYSENILEVTMKWSDWPQEFCQDNYLCFKFNQLLDLLQLVHDPQTSLFSELRYASKKNFHKYCFQYSNCSLGFRKDAKTENPTTAWLVRDVVIYVGIQQHRYPPTKWGFTIYSPKEKLISPYFGHSICCSSEEEMYHWLSAMLFSQHTDGFRLRKENSFAPKYSGKSWDPNWSPTLGAQNLESNSTTTSGLTSKWKLPFIKRR